MKVSARNLIPGVVKKVNIGMVNAEVVIEAAPDVEIVSVITKESVERMGIKVGSKVKAMVKATSVMVVTDFGISRQYAPAAVFQGRRAF